MSQEERNSGAQTHGKHQRKKRGAYPGGLEARAQQNQETNGETPDIPDAPDSAPAPAEPEPDPEELEWEAAEQKRVADMTRTVQVSIEQILAAAAEQEAAAPPPPSEEPEPVTEPDNTVETLPQTLGRGAVRFGKWTLLVVCSVLLIAGAGIAWLWNGATETAIPEMTVTLDGEELPVTAYSWKVPVIGNSLKRTYADTVSTSPYQLSTEVESTHPDIRVTPDNMVSQLTVHNDSGDEVFSGTLKEFAAVRLPGNGGYQAELVLHEPVDRFEEGGTISGSQTYQFAFTVEVRPTVRLNTTSVPQGSVAAILVSELEEGDVPELKCEFANCGFVPCSRGWVCYLPIPYDTQPGSYQLRVVTKSYDQAVTLTVRSAAFGYRDYQYQSQLVSPWIPESETPEQVSAVLETCDPQIYWSAKGFVQPFVSSITIDLPFGTTEYVGRSSAQRAGGGGNGRTSTNTVVSTRKGNTFIAPAEGRVLLAEDLGGDAGNTVVIEHGAGLKSIFYCLGSLSVEEGEMVVQGQALGTTSKRMVAEARIGTVPVDGFAIWRDQCDAIKTY